MTANNETGICFPIRECASLAHANEAILFTDATQALGKISLDAEKDGFDLAVFSAHKLNGPMGIGALYIRGWHNDIREDARHLGIDPVNFRTSGTLNVAGIVGFGKACQLAQGKLASESMRISRLRDRLESSLLSQCPEIKVNGAVGKRIPNTSNICFKGVNARTLIRDFHEVAVSTRSACSSGSSEPSHVLKALGLGDEEVYSSVRFSLGRFTTDAEIDHTIKIVAASYHKLRNLPSLG